MRRFFFNLGGRLHVRALKDESTKYLLLKSKYCFRKASTVLEKHSERVSHPPS